MATTRLKRKDRKNKTVSRQTNQIIKLNTKLVSAKSPNKDKVVVVED